MSRWFAAARDRGILSTRNPQGNMIIGVTIRNFRGIREIANLPLRDFHVLVGPNGSGKSSFLDAIDFVRDCLSLGLVGAVELRDIPDFHDLTWMRRGGVVEIELWLDLARHAPEFQAFLFKYRLVIEQNYTRGVFVRDEELLRYQRPVSPPGKVPALGSQAGARILVGKVASGTAFFANGRGNALDRFAFGPNKPVLANTPQDDKRYPAANAVRRFLLQGIRSLKIDSTKMRRPCLVTHGTELELDGGNLARVVGRAMKSSLILEEGTVLGPLWPRSETPIAIWADHLRYALPDLAKIGWARRQADNAEYLVVRLDSGLEIPGWLLSDGTLRMMALTIPAFLPPERALYMVEEPENGVHPNALEIILRSLSCIPGSQTLIATHSPDVVTQCGSAPLLCFSRDEDGTHVMPGPLHPVLARWDGTPELGSVFAAGLLE